VSEKQVRIRRPGYDTDSTFCITTRSPSLLVGTVLKDKSGNRVGTIISARIDPDDARFFMAVVETEE
jgi:hypothetical protein